MSTVALIGVGKRFGTRTVLDDVSFAFEPATSYLITGRSGCGKSTVLNLLAGYVKPDSGRVVGAGARGYLFQDELLFANLTVRQNLAIRLTALGVTPAEHDAVTERALDRVDVGALADEPVHHLSGGERQRVQVATLLVADPELVLMDEPTSKLDAENRLGVAKAVVELFAGKTLVVVSHEEQNPLYDGAVRLRLHESRLSHE